MKPLQFSKGSWHYWLAREGDFDPGNTFHLNICVYLRKVLKGFMIVGFFSTLGLFLLFCAGKALVFLFKVWFMHATVNPVPPLEVVGLCTLFVAIVATGLIMGMDQWEQYKDRRRDRKEWEAVRALKDKTPLPAPKPSFISEAYKSLKDKTCVRIEIVRK